MEDGCNLYLACQGDNFEPYSPNNQETINGFLLRHERLYEEKFTTGTIVDETDDQTDEK